ncbi:conjugal transfer protein [Bacillus methanolicus]|uniref:Conserved hypothetical secreted protein n=1 Tax=Bacillus methanolicus (strain MGA3 / ATCC 53907) TaxID=796606 RepID=I3DTJ7_BACMM|nr:conjugal transfer protein [Bacillus methanolicus]AIE61706.1 Conserved hypothetical secreted protein [Bacillus methanolicus MGA3]EIJ77568.1 putative transposase [Bacillus methanolicus MGA3]
MKKREYPKTVFRKKIIKGIFWTGFFSVLFLSVVAIVRVGNAGTSQAEAEPMHEEVKKEENLAVSEGAQSFAQNFATQYFNWQNTDAGKKDRVKRLKLYLATGLDEQAGLGFEGMQWNSSLSKSQVWNVEETGKDTALITLRVQHMLKKITHPDPKVVKDAKKAKKEPPKAKEETIGPFEKYFVVPVKTDGQSFVVYEIPYFIAAPKKPEIVVNTTVDQTDKVNDLVLQQEVLSFLHTFLKVYTTGTQEELSYYTQDNLLPSMSGIMTFQEIKNLLIKKGDHQNTYQIFITAVFQENQSKAQVVYPYKLTIVKKEGRWFVKEMKNQ